MRWPLRIQKRGGMAKMARGEGWLEERTGRHQGGWSGERGWRMRETRCEETPLSPWTRTRQARARVKVVCQHHSAPFFVSLCVCGWVNSGGDMSPWPPEEAPRWVLPSPLVLAWPWRTSACSHAAPGPRRTSKLRQRERERKGLCQLLSTPRHDPLFFFFFFFCCRCCSCFLFLFVFLHPRHPQKCAEGIFVITEHTPPSSP